MSAYRRWAVIPDTQCRPGVPLQHLEWAGRYIAEKEVDLVVHLGDHWDFPSLSHWDQGKPKLFEGRRALADIEAGNKGLELLTAPIQARDRKRKKKTRRLLLRGNHEDRLRKAVEANPAQLEGLLDEDRFNDVSLGWEVVPFLKPVTVDGIGLAHYWYSPRSGKPYGGTAQYIIQKVGRSFIAGHRQGVDYGFLDVPGGGRRRSIIAGSFYQHDEEYVGPQANDHWRGILILNEVRDGNFDVCEVSLDYLKREWS